VEIQLSQMLRLTGIREGIALGRHARFFVNTHPLELAMPGLIDSMKVVREISCDQRITLEIHEAAVTNPKEMKELRAELCDLNIGLAFDDFGAGQTRLAELTEVHPDYLKFDISLIRSIHLASDEHRKMVGTLVEMVRSLGVTPLAEGISAAGECQVCVDLGFELAQGFLFGKPAPFLIGNGRYSYSFA
jgi:EAL domain-containing protein (putative c-di-GMP-specific phosphodiesterase class I)